MVNTNENKKTKDTKKNNSKSTSNSTSNKTTKKSSVKNAKTTSAKTTSVKNTTKSNKKITADPEIITKKVSKNDTQKVSKIVHENNIDTNSTETKFENTDVSNLEKRLKKAEKNYSKNKDFVEKNYSTNKIYAEKSKVKNKKHSSRKKINNFIYNIIICISLGLIAYSSYNILLWHKDNQNNKKLIDEVTNSTPISNIENVSINENLNIQKKSYDFQNLLSQNPDTVGWISVPNTEINYPVVKGENNEFYLKHSFDKKYNAGGWIYADYRNKCDNTDNNLIIYGHNRLNNNMFGTLENVLKDSWLSEPSNHYINYSSTTKSQIYEIFSTFICKSSASTEYLQTDFSSTEEYRKYLENIKNKSSYYFDVRVTENDKIITLYTCHGLNNERLLVFGRLITEN